MRNAGVEAAVELHGFESSHESSSERVAGRLGLAYCQKSGNVVQTGDGLRHETDDFGSVSEVHWNISRTTKDPSKPFSPAVDSPRPSERDSMTFPAHYVNYVLTEQTFQTDGSEGLLGS